MRLMMTFLYTMLFFLFGNSKEIFFENINVGDDLETCLANGSVQYKNNGISLELPSSNIATNYFTYNVVKFDQDNIIKEIKFTFHQNNTTKTTAKEVSNYMVQYFCQRYKGMKVEEIHEKKKEDGWEIIYRQDGKKHIWETNKVKIILESYYNTLLEYEINHRKSEHEVVFNWTANHAEQEVEGHWVKLDIIAK